MELRRLPDTWFPEEPHPPLWEDWHCLIDAVFLGVLAALFAATLVMALSRL